MVVHPSFLSISAFGPLAAKADGQTVALRGKPAALLALLSCFAGEVVPHALVVETLWDAADPPADPRRAVRQVLRRLGTNLPTDCITSTVRGHRLETERAAVDVQTCRILLRAGSDHDQLRAALRLWSGTPFPELTHVPEVQSVVRELDALRLDAVETLCEAQLRRGGGYPLVAELERLVALHPERERLWQLLALALHRCSRRLDALRTIERCRTACAGAGLSPATRRIEQALLLDELELAG